MAREGYGGGGLASKKELVARRKHLGLELPPTVDLNRSPVEVLAAHPQIGKRLAQRIARLREKGAIRTPADLYKARVIDARQLKALEQVSFGTLAQRPLITSISIPGEYLYVDEPFSVRIDFTPGALLPAELITIDVRFPSGRKEPVHFKISETQQKEGRVEVGEFVSGEAGEFHLIATLRDAVGNVHRQAASFGVFTRNPVRMYITPSFWTQSGNVGAPKFNFTERRWYCYADVRWVNGTDSRVNLGRTVTVRMTDAGSHIGTFSFNLSGDIIIPARSTVYGNLYTYHPEGSSAFNVFHAKGDLTYQYSMSGSGFTPTTNQIWRTMRVVGFNIIRVGDFTNTERNEYRRAGAEVASGIFQNRDMTVYGVELYRVEGDAQMDADKTRFRFIDSEDEMRQLSSRYTVSNWFLDVFFVEGVWDGSFGMAFVNGPVDKEGELSGIIIRRDSDTVNLGQTFAHEAGHYLGLEHADEDDGCSDTNPSDPNIGDNFIFSSSARDSDFITLCQIDKMRRHGLVRSMTA